MFRSYIIALSLLAWLAPSLLHAQNPYGDFKDFKATVAGSTRLTMTLYRSGSLIRTDVEKHGYHITNFATHTAYDVMIDGRCLERPAAPQLYPFIIAAGAQIESTPAGEEVIDGHKCKVENFTVTEDGRSTRMKIWAAQDLKGFPIKVEIATPRGTSTVLYKDVEFVKPAPALFVPPPSCRQGLDPARPR